MFVGICRFVHYGENEKVFKKGLTSFFEKFSTDAEIFNAKKTLNFKGFPQYQQSFPQLLAQVLLPKNSYDCQKVVLVEMSKKIFC